MLNRRLPLRRSSKRSKVQSAIESLESRTLFSAAVESASAQLHLLSTTGTTATPVYNYGITLTDTGTTNLGTFWFAWTPGADFLPSLPSSESSPAGWGNEAGTLSTPDVTGSNNSSDGSALRWVAQSGSTAVTPGNSLSGFDFSTTDSPAILNGHSPTHSTTPVLTSTVYSGGPFSDSGFPFVVDGVVVISLTATTTTLTSSAPSVAAGASVTFTATVTSTSSGATPTGTVTFTQGSTTLGSEVVQSDGTAAFSTSSLAVGSDPIIASYGGDANYIASNSPAFTETVTLSANAPTLAPTIAKSTLPAMIVSDAKVHAVISVDVSNQTGAPIKGKTKVDLFATTDGVIDSGSTLVGSQTRSLNLKTDKPAVVPVKLTSALAGLPAGTYTLLARTIDPSAHPTDAAAGPTVQVAAPLISFSESFSKLTLPPNVTAGAKTRATASLQITNNGNIQSTGTTTISFYASVDGLIDGTATLIQSAGKTLRIKPGKMMTLSTSIKAFPAVAAGDYFIVAHVTDSQGHATTAVSGMQVTVS